jgi:hypothetical protein
MYTADAQQALRISKSAKAFIFHIYNENIVNIFYDFAAQNSV